MKVQDKIVVVTGAGGGLGQQLVLQLVREGNHVAAVDINRDALDATKLKAAEFSRTLSIHRADITDKEQILSLAKEIGERFGKIDILINNAGIIQPFKTFYDLEDDAIQRIFNINVYGMINMTKAFLPLLAAADESSLCNISSMGGFLPVPGQSIYGASKASVKIITEALVQELSRTNIHVSVVFPGGIDTDIKKNSGLKEESSGKEKASAGLKLTTPEKAAEIILQGIRLNKQKILIGKDALIMDIIYRLFPFSAARLISRKMSKNHGRIFNEPESLKNSVMSEHR